jgi:hypothetical protein
MVGWTGPRSKPRPRCFEVCATPGAGRWWDVLLQMATVCLKRPLHGVLDDGGELSEVPHDRPDEVDKMAVEEASLSQNAQELASSQSSSSFFLFLFSFFSKLTISLSMVPSSSATWQLGRQDDHFQGLMMIFPNSTRTSSSRRAHTSKADPPFKIPTTTD